MRQTRQGGSSIVFILVGVLLAALLVGGVYILRQQTAQKPVAVTPQPQSTSPAKPEAPKEDKEEVPSNNETTQQKEATHDEKAIQQSQPASAAELPRTGGSGDLGIVLSAALFAGVLVAYVNSRRAVRLSF